MVNKRHVNHKLIQEAVDIHTDMMLRIASHHVKSIHTAEDIVQEVFIKLMGQDKVFVSDDHLKAWLIRSTVNKCHDYHRSAWFRKAVSLFEINQTESIDENNGYSGLYQAMEDIPHKDRDLIYLYYYEGYKIGEIAEMLDINKNTISARLQRARVKLKVKLMEEGNYVSGRI